MMNFYIMDIWKQTELILEDFLLPKERELPFFPFIG